MGHPLRGSFCVRILHLRKLGDSNPRYGYPYGSLANCWFQPLTQTSIGIPRQSIFSQMRVQRYELFSIPPNFIATISLENEEKGEKAIVSL